VRSALHLIVDSGVDDALAVIAAALHPDMGLAEVTACAGNVPLTASVGNTRLVLDVLAPRTGTVARSRGAATRMDGTPFPVRTVHGPDGLAGLRSRASPAGSDAVVGDRADGATLPRVARAAGRLVCAGPATTLTWLEPGAAVTTYGCAGEVNHDLDPDAAGTVASTWSLEHPSPPRPLTEDEVESAWGQLSARDRAAPLARMVRTLLRHQVERGAGLGDADAVLGLAGSTDPLGDLVDLLRR
jgi:hypothetical protein